MPSHSGPKLASKDNLVFALDAADKKNSFLPFSTFLNMSYWSLGPGSATYYGQNGGTDENERVNGTDPWGNPAIVWESRPNGNGYDDGGWNSSWFSIDRTKLYRFSVWVKRTSSTAGGTSYLGLYGTGGSWGVARLDGGGIEGNPYWQCAGTSTYTQDQWYLLVGHCYPAQTTGIPGNKHPDTGRYTVNGKDGDLNYCNIGGDVRWQGDATEGLHRVYHYYCNDNTTRLQWYDPRFEVCDGTEPTIDDLLRSPATYGRSLIANTKGTLVNGTIWNRSNQGTFVLDGTNDYINLGDSSLWDFGQNGTIEIMVKPSNSTGNDRLWCIDNNSSNLDAYLDGTGYSLGLHGGAVGSTTPLTQDSWNHVVVTYNSGTVQIYINGVAGTMTGTTTGYNITNNSGNNSNLYIGCYRDLAYNLYGSVSVFKLYNTSLSPNQIKQNYNQYKTRFNLS